jgi:hypothetical protein
VPLAFVGAFPAAAGLAPVSDLAAGICTGFLAAGDLFPAAGAPAFPAVVRGFGLVGAFLAGAGALAACGLAGAAAFCPGAAAGLRGGVDAAAGAALLDVAAAPLPPPVDVAGIVITTLHFGQGPFLPANWSLTVKRALQPGQTTAIGIASLGRWVKSSKSCDGHNGDRQKCPGRLAERKAQDRPMKRRLQFRTAMGQVKASQTESSVTQANPS